VNISKAVIFPIWVFSIVLLFLLTKWAGPSIEASRKSRSKMEMAERPLFMVYPPIRPSLLSIISILSFTILPFAAIILQPRSTLITDSIKDHHALAPIIAVFIILLVTYLNRKVLFNKQPHSGALAILFLSSSIFSVSDSNEIYRSAMEYRLFSGKTLSYSRVMPINHLSIVHRRHGLGFLGHVNPNKVSTIDPKIRITVSLYNLLVTTDNDGAVVPNGFPTCSVRLVVERSGSAERIVAPSLVDTSNVVECQRPM
jgi:hypothetical protein